jgi:hypothetical protein
MAFQRATVLDSFNLTQFSFVNTSTFSVGAVKLQLIKNSWEDSGSEYVVGNTIFGNYRDAQGSFEFWASSPTASGTMFVLNRFQDVLNKAERFVSGKIQSPIYLEIDESVRSVITSAKLTYENLTSIETLKKWKCKVDYTRRGLVLSSIGNTAFIDPSLGNQYGSVNSTLRERYVSTTQLTTQIETPVNAGIKFYNLDRYIPSGYFAISSEPIFTLSGSWFNNSSVASNPTQLRTTNQNTFNPFSVYGAGTPDNGMQTFIPTNFSTITTSGQSVWGSFSNSDTFATTATAADVYATVRTTFSGTIFGVQVLGYNILNSQQCNTPETFIQDAPYPQVIYLGKLDAGSILSKTNLYMKYRAVNVASGALLLDRLIFIPSPDYNKSSVRLVSTVDLYDDRYDTQTTVSSGNGYLILDQNYLPDLNAYDTKIYPKLRGYKERNAIGFVTTLNPTYTGSLDVFLQKSMLDEAFSVTMYVNGHYIATGSTYQTVSGLNNWLPRDRHNNTIRTRFNIAAPQTVSTNLPYGVT